MGYFGGAYILETLGTPDSVLKIGEYYLHSINLAGKCQYKDLLNERKQNQFKIVICLFKSSKNIKTTNDKK